MICYNEQNLSFCILYGVWGNDFQILEEKKSFYFITCNFFVITAV